MSFADYVPLRLVSSPRLSPAKQALQKTGYQMPFDAILRRTRATEGRARKSPGKAAESSMRLKIDTRA